MKAKKGRFQTESTQGGSVLDSVPYSPQTMKVSRGRTRCRGSDAPGGWRAGSAAGAAPGAGGGSSAAGTGTAAPGRAPAPPPAAGPWPCNTEHNTASYPRHGNSPATTTGPAAQPAETSE